jgi:hypothetical protein
VLFETMQPIIERTVFLGDMFDDFKGRNEQTAVLYREWLDDPQVDVLLGNHDLNYIMPNGLFWCSGDAMQTRQWVTARVGSPYQIQARYIDTGRVKIATTVHGYLCSHAGVAQHWIDSRHINMMPLKAAGWADFLNTRFRACAAQIAMYNNPGAASDGIFDVDMERGGRHPAGGPLWGDWTFLRENLTKGLHQIVGHTPDTNVRIVGEAPASALCLDTHLHHAMVVWPGGKHLVFLLPAVNDNPAWRILRRRIEKESRD